MNIRCFLPVALVTLLFVVCTPGRAAGVELSLKSDTSKKCAICHYQWVSTFFLEHRSTPIAHSGEKPLEFFSWEMCISCHDSSVKDSRKKICEDPGHRVGRIPSEKITIPPGFPLDEKGALKCTTCHTPHAVSKGSGAMVEYFLRAPNENSSFCRMCHKRKLGGLPRGNHPIDVSAKIDPGRIIRAGGKFGTALEKQIICETCHTAHGGVNEQFLVLPLEKSRSMSVLCEACHTEKALRPGSETDAGRTHPVDVVPGISVQIPKSWHNGEKVVTGSRGQLVCRTCHKPHHADREFLLAIPEGKDRLCLQCHTRDVLVMKRVYDFWEPVSSVLGHSSLPVEEGLVCSACHRVHENIELFRTLDRPHIVSDPVFTLPHFGLHPRTFFGTAFNDTDGKGAGEGYLFPEEASFPGGGTIVCATCHVGAYDLVSETPGELQDGGDSAPGFIRQDIAETLCKTCHGEEALVRFLYFHSKW